MSKVWIMGFTYVDVMNYEIGFVVNVVCLDDDDDCCLKESLFYCCCL